MLRRWSVLLLLAVSLAWPAAAAARPDLETTVPVQVVSAKDLERAPSCFSVLSELVNIPPAPAVNISKSSITLRGVPPPETGSLLDGVRIRTRDGVEHPIHEPICVESVDVLRGGVEAIYGADAVGGVIDFLTTHPGPGPLGSSDLYTSGFYAEPFLNPSQMQIIRGPFDGRGPGTSVDVGGKAGRILVETPEALFWLLPEDVPHGSVSLTLTDAGRGARFPVYVLGLAMSADQLKLLRGQSTQMQATVFGPEAIPADAWKAGDVSATVDLGLVANLFPDFRIPKPGEPGVLFFRVDNASRDTVSMKPSKNESFIVNLRQADFASGPYTYRARIQSKKAGGFTINGIVVGFFAPIPGEPWTPPPFGLGLGESAAGTDSGR